MVISIQGSFLISPTKVWEDLDHLSHRMLLSSGCFSLKLFRRLFSAVLRLLGVFQTSYMEIV